MFSRVHLLHLHSVTIPLPGLNTLELRHGVLEALRHDTNVGRDRDNVEAILQTLLGVGAVGAYRASAFQRSFNDKPTENGSRLASLVSGLEDLLNGGFVLGTFTGHTELLGQVEGA